MVSDAERRLNDRGASLEEWDFGRDDEPDISGYLVLIPEGAGAQIHAIIRPGLKPDRRAGFADWVLVRIDRFFEHGPEPDGWQKRTSDGGWQLWARDVWLSDPGP